MDRKPIYDVLRTAIDIGKGIVYYSAVTLSAVAICMWATDTICRHYEDKRIEAEIERVDRANRKAFERTPEALVWNKWNQLILKRETKSRLKE